MKANKNTFEIGIPNEFKHEDVLFRNYPKWTELHYSHGFRDYIKPTITESQKLSEIFYDEEKDIVTHNIIDFTPEEIAEYQLSLVPKTITRLQLRLQMVKAGIPNAYILAIINTITNRTTKSEILIKWENATTFDRMDNDLINLWLAMNKTESELNDFFTNAASL